MEEIIEILAKKYNMPKGQIRAICESPFRFVVENMRQRSLKTINFLNFGKFAIHRLKKERILKKMDILNEYDREQGERRKTTRNIPRLEKPSVQKSADREVSKD